MKNKKNKKMVLVVLLMVMALLLSGCDDDDDSSTSSPAPTAAPTAVPGEPLLDLAADTGEVVEKAQSGVCVLCLLAEDAENCRGVCGGE